MNKYILFSLFLIILAGCDSSQNVKSYVPVKDSKSGVYFSTSTKIDVDENDSDNNLCDKNYSDCVPVASDVDCAGGSGNGPVYVRGPIQVIGKDIYKLDRDHDGIACE